MRARVVTPFFPYGTQILLISHSLFWLATNLVSPFLSIFFITEMTDVTVSEVGIASLIFYLSFGVLGPVMGFISDRIDGLKDELVFVIFGYIARGVLFMLFALASNAWHLYMFQFFLGAFRAVAGPADKVLYSKYLEGRQSATMWGIDESLINIFAALGAGVGGYLVSIYGFRYVFVLTGAVTIVAGLVNFPLLNGMRQRAKKRVRIK
ncbi:MAG: MFS transporter [bacterium]|nr:MFS transporter [bacterium]